MRTIASPQIAQRPDNHAAVEEATAFLAKHPDIVAFDIILTDLNGIGRGKTVRRHELESIYDSGRHLPGSILGLDVTGEDVDETGLVWSDGDADRCAWPVAGSLVPLPWIDPPRGQLQLALHELDGSPMQADPRHALVRQKSMLEQAGFMVSAAFELEFYLLDRNLGSDGIPLPAKLPLTGERPSGINVYGTEDLDRLEPFTAALYTAAEAQGLPVETMISEYAAGQFELTLRHRDVLRAADDLVMLKRLIRGLAMRHDMRACFMAKPFAEQAGSGMHLHASFSDKAGKNIFEDRDGLLVPELLHAVGGLLATLPETMLIFAPHYNSWHRFSAQSYAPTRANWGVNNRGVAVRVPAGAAKGRHLEQRMAGVDANPYLVATTVLAAMRLGLDKRSDPGSPADGDGHAGDVGAVLPTSWVEAVASAGSSAFLRDALGDRLLHVLLALKRAELSKFSRYVSPLEYRFYLDTI